MVREQPDETAIPSVGRGKIVREKHYHELADALGFKWIGDKVPSTSHAKTSWECPEGHRFRRKYQHLRERQTCSECMKLEDLLGPADYHALAEEKGLVWIGDESVRITTRDITPWRCSVGHKWRASYKDIRFVQNPCPICNQPTGEDDYHNLAAALGFVWVGDILPKNTSTATTWQCARCGEKGEKSYAYLKGKKVPCVWCKRDKRCRELARERGFIWLGPRVEHCRERTGWGCSNCGHHWSTTYDSIQQGTSCPSCMAPGGGVVNGIRASQPQRELHSMIGGELNAWIDGMNVDILLNRGGRRIAIEYDSWYWHADHMEHDRDKTERLVSIGVSVLRIRTNNGFLPSPERIERALSELRDGIKASKILTTERWGQGETFHEADG